MRGISPKPVDKDSLVDAMNKEIIPLLREMRKLLSDGGSVAVAFVPDHYTRLTAPARWVWQLVAHLKGIDQELGALKARVAELEAHLPP